MASDSFNQILTEIAKKNNTSPDHVRSEMQKAMDAAMRNPDPAVQARWASSPRKGAVPTLEEFIEYMAVALNAIQSFS